MSNIIIISGHCASGKTRLGLLLTKDLRIPYLSKDLYKEALFDQLGWNKLEWSKMDALAYNLLFLSAKQIIDAGSPVILESNFTPADVLAIRKIKRRHQIIQIVCVCEADIRIKRFKKRWEKGYRHPGHVDRRHYDAVRRTTTNKPQLLELEGPLIEVNTASDKTTCYPQLLKQLKELL